MNLTKIILPGFAILLLANIAQAQNNKYDTWEQNYTVQALLGAVQFENLKFDYEDSAGGSAEVDISLIPQLGAAWSTLPKGDRFQYGLETSFLLGFRFDEINYLSAGGGGLHVSISTSMWMFDFSGGGYASLFLDPDHKIRIYAGGGPLMIYADYRSEHDEDGITDDNNESAFGLGLYARTGIEFRVHEKGMLGLGARSSWSTVDLTEVGGSSELVGFALFASYTAGF